MLLVMVGVGSLLFGLTLGTTVNLVVPALAFGIIVMSLIYTIGPISGCHVNPAVSIGVWSIGGMKTKDMVIYVVVQIIGGIIGAAVLYYVFMDAHTAVGAFATTTYHDANLIGSSAYSMGPVFLVELISALILQIVILGSLGNKGNEALAGVSIGLVVGAIILFSGGIDGTGLNPIRDLSPALFAGGKYLEQAWLFVVAPIIGAVIGSWLFKWMATPAKKAA
jgi:aquaporin Z